MTGAGTDRPIGLGALLLASWALGSRAWWPFGSSAAAADITGRYGELDSAGAVTGHGLIARSEGNRFHAVFEGKPWSPATLEVSGNNVKLGGVSGYYEGGVIRWPDGKLWRTMPQHWVPPPRPTQEEAEDDDSAATCEWKPLSEHGESSTECYGHSVRQHDSAKDAAECLDSYAKKDDCNFVSFDKSIGRCWCKLSCPAQVLRPSTSSFEKLKAFGPLSGMYVERGPNGEVGKEGMLIQRGGALEASFAGHPWSPATGSVSGDDVYMFGGSLKGRWKNGASIVWQNSWQWVKTFPLPKEVLEAKDMRTRAGDSDGINNVGWVPSRAQTPHIVQQPSELVDFAWQAAANITCEVSEEDVRFYDEHGWVHLKQVLDPGALDLILDEAQTICKKQLGERGVCQIEQLRWQVNRFRDFMLYSPMGCYAHKLIRGKGVRITTEALFGTQYNEKNPSFFSYMFHVDSMNGHRGVYHAFTSRSKGVSVWFPMHDVDPDETGGSVYVLDEYTGDKAPNHCKYMECGGQVQAGRTSMPPQLQCDGRCAGWYAHPSWGRAKTFKFRKGDAVFWHPEMPHATQPIRVRNFTRHSFTIRLVDSEAEVCNVGGNCGDWMGCCADLPLANGEIKNHCFPQIYPKVLDEEVAAHYSSTPKHLMGDQAWVDYAHTVTQGADCL